MSRGLSLALWLLVAPVSAQAQDEGAPAEGDTVGPGTAGPPMRVVGCPERSIDPEVLRQRVALELGEAPRRGISIEVEIDCGSGAARVSVIDEHGACSTRSADLGETEGTARTWALAIVIADFLRRPHEPSSAPAPASSPPSSPARALTRPSAPERPEEEPAPETPRAAPSTWLDVGVAGRLTLENGPTGVGSLMLAVRHDWLRVGITIGGTHRGHELGQIPVALALADLAVLPLSYSEPRWALAGELFVQGGVLYATGIPASSSVDGSDAVGAVFGAGVGVRMRIAPSAPVGVALGLRAGYDFAGLDLAAGSTSLVRIYGFFGSLDAALVIALQ